MTIFTAKWVVFHPSISPQRNGLVSLKLGDFPFLIDFVFRFNNLNIFEFLQNIWS